MALFSRLSDSAGKSRPASVRMTNVRLPVLMAICVLFAGSAAAQERQVWVRVEDPAGATIPGPQIIVLAGSDVLDELRADGKGLALARLGTAREIKLIVSAPGFATAEKDVTIPARPPQQVIVALAIANIESDV